jgi:hypothetical protein
LFAQSKFATIESCEPSAFAGSFASHFPARKAMGASGEVAADFSAALVFGGTGESSALPGNAASIEAVKAKVRIRIVEIGFFIFDDVSASAAAGIVKI